MAIGIGAIGVGIGEAGSSPPSHSMISDLYPPEKRATAMGIYAAGINVGVLLGFLVGGWIDEWYGWRMAFSLSVCPASYSAFNVLYSARTDPHASAQTNAEKHFHRGLGNI